ncbi:phosphatidylinositol phosphate synthase [Rhizohabitans arisaemae]|uniref:phosphatidylinositol phosphate synthase n=1 Tax=Rhizohabitans arisaemae TaxID=2720610 RepID=UPI0024B1E38D|nr:CDP-alcohol phosphatidyltransferase family protein [Rhizohabitans arisaemae]
MLKVLRPAVTRVLNPLGRALADHGISPNVITVVGTLGAVGGALAFYPRGVFFWGSVVITVFVLLDLLDGVVARITGSTGKWGAFLDSTMDRVADAAIFSGLILWAMDRDRPLVGALALFCLVAGAVVSYTKARAEGLGMTCDVGVAERPERLIVILVSTAFSEFLPILLPIGLALLAAASAFTVYQRLITVYRQAVPGDR